LEELAEGILSIKQLNYLKLNFERYNEDYIDKDNSFRSGNIQDTLTDVGIAALLNSLNKLKNLKNLNLNFSKSSQRFFFFEFK